MSVTARCVASYPVAMEREAFEHYLRDETRRGPVPDGAFTGAAGGAACGDLSRISLLLDDGRIVDATFDAEGCGATRAATAAAVEMAYDASVLTRRRSGSTTSMPRSAG